MRKTEANWTVKFWGIGSKIETCSSESITLDEFATGL